MEDHLKKMEKNEDNLNKKNEKAEDNLNKKSKIKTTSKKLKN